MPDLVLTLAERPPLRIRLTGEQAEALADAGLLDPTEARSALSGYLDLEGKPSREDVRRLGEPVAARVREVLLWVAGHQSEPWQPDMYGVLRARRAVGL